MNTPAVTRTDGKTETVTVAHGHSIRHGGKTYSAGHTVSLPAADVARLRARGFIAPPRDVARATAQEKARTQGPTVETRSGPTVKRR